MMIALVVALRKESVDRNPDHELKGTPEGASLSARRAWIEIAIVSIVIFCIMGSLSARRAWIEMTTMQNSNHRRFSRSPQGERG